MKNYILINKFIEIKSFEKKYISKRFLSFLNDKNINKFLSTRLKKQTKKTVLQYFSKMIKENNIYNAIFDRTKKKLIGTITLRKMKNNSCYISFMFGDKRYFGTKFTRMSISIFMSHIFRIMKFKFIFAGCDKNNLQSAFFLRKYGFKIIEKSRVINKGLKIIGSAKKNFFFILNKKNLKEKYIYKYCEIR